MIYISIFVLILFLLAVFSFVLTHINFFGNLLGQKFVDLISIAILKEAFDLVITLCARNKCS